MIHGHYLDNKQWSTSKTGRHFNYFNANGSTQASLYSLGYKYYYKKTLGFFSNYMLLKIKEVKVIDGETYCLCSNTINFEYLIKPEELFLNVN